MLSRNFGPMSKRASSTSVIDIRQVQPNDLDLPKVEEML